jgi:hypothetical protein
MDQDETQTRVRDWYTLNTQKRMEFTIFAYNTFYAIFHYILFPETYGYQSAHVR